MTHLASPRTFLLSLLGMLAPFFFPAYSARAQKGIVDGVAKPPVIDKHDIRFNRLSVNGEPLQSWISAIVQDDYGFLWVGTLDGLYKYDGYNLKAYRHERGNPNSVADDYIRALYKDRDGSLWIGTGYGGLDRLDPNRDTFTHYPHESRNPGSLLDSNVVCVYQDRRGQLWVGTDGGLDRLEPASGTFVHYRHNPQDAGSLSNNIVTSIYEDRRGTLWIGTEIGLNKLERATGRFSHFLHDPANPHSIGHNYVYCILEDRSGVLWVASPNGNGLSALDVKTGEFTRYSFRTEETSSQSVTGVNSVFEDQDGALWLCTLDRGLLRLDRERKTFTRYAREPGDPNSLPHDSVTSLFEDAEGVMWVGTRSGLSRFQRRPPPFVNYQHEPDSPNSLRDNGIQSVQADSQGFLWIGEEHGLNRLNLRTGEFTFYQHDPKDPHSLSYNKVAAIREDPSGTLWFGTYGGGLDRFDRTTGRFFAYRHDPKNPASLSNDAVMSLLIDRQGTLWVGTQGGGLDHFDSTTGRFSSYLTDPSNPDVYVLFEDRAGMLWVGGDWLTRFDPRTGQVTAYHHNPDDPQSLSSDKVNAIREDRQGRLWIGTENGLNLLDRNRGTATLFTTKEGLPNNVIRSILEDRHGYLWLGTHNGLSRFDPQTRTFRNYSESDGLASNLLGVYAAEGSCQTPSGEMVFGSSNGVTVFNPDRISDNPYVPPVRLTDFLLFNQPLVQGKDSPLSRSIWATDSLTLTHRQSIFTLEFAALSYTAPERNRYRYRLEGLETQWNEVESGRRTTTYTNLPAGKYLFRVQGSNNDGVWNRKGVSLAITVLPPWWATWWFRSAAGLLIIGIAWAAYRSRVKGLQRQTARLELEVAQRTRELQASERLFRSIFEDAQVGISVFSIDGRQHSSNRAMHEMLGYTEKELSRLEQWDEITHPDERASCAERYVELQQGKREKDEYEQRFIRRDGGIVIANGRFSLLRDAEGKPRYVVALTEDITERRRAEEELRRANLLAETALELTKAGYWQAPLDGSGWYNSSPRRVALFGDIPNPEYRYRIEDVFAGAAKADAAAAQNAREAFKAAVEGNTDTYDTVYAYKRPIDGEIVWVHALGHISRDTDGKPTDMYGVSQDISEFKRLEREIVTAKEAAEAATKSKSEFLANMSHEIRTPMNAVIGMTRLALNTELTPKQKDYLNKIKAAADSLLGIINDILDFSKIEAGKLDMEKTDFRLEEVLENLSTVVGQKAHDKNLEFLIAARQDFPPNLVGDPLRLGQILINLVNNAVKFTEHGEVVVSVTMEERASNRVKLKFSVRDSGIGMTKEQAARLFQAFSQADTSTTRKYGGTGLGLSISKRLVELMGGNIRVESEFGRGSTFSFNAWFGVKSAAIEQKRFIPDLAGLRALVVDDNVQAREILTELLKQFALRVEHVSSGEGALRELGGADSQDPYRLVLMDWHMPGMDGLETSRIIRRGERLSHVPKIVMVTAFGQDDVRARAEETGIEGYLQKPVSPSMLYDALMDLFGLARPGTPSLSQGKKETHSHDARGIRILLVEDNEVNQQVARETLESAGASVTIANHGGEAVEILTRGEQPPPFDVVLMDLQMPEVDGFTATRLLRAKPELRELPIIAMTADVMAEAVERCLEAGMNDHVGKPIDPHAAFRHACPLDKIAGGERGRNWQPSP